MEVVAGAGEISPQKILKRRSTQRNTDTSQPKTPASGIADHVWSLEELLTASLRRHPYNFRNGIHQSSRLKWLRQKIVPGIL